MRTDGPLERVSRDADSGAPEGGVGVVASSSSSDFFVADAAHRNMEVDGNGSGVNDCSDL